MKQAIAIRHLAFEDLGIFENELSAAGYRTVYLDAGVDDLTAIDLTPSDLLIVLGGPIGADEERFYPFLKDELRLLENALSRSVPLLGICLGAQLMARALGARVMSMPEKEIGFGAIDLSEAGKNSCLGLIEPAGSRVLHWHGDMFDLPAGAERLASSRLAINQAFSFGPTALALQFHLEMDPAMFERWLIGHTCELRSAAIDIAQLRADGARHGRTIETVGRDVIRQWLVQLSLRRPVDETPSSDVVLSGAALSA